MGLKGCTFSTGAVWLNLFCTAMFCWIWSLGRWGLGVCLTLAVSLCGTAGAGLANWVEIGCCWICENWVLSCWPLTWGPNCSRRELSSLFCIAGWKTKTGWGVGVEGVNSLVDAVWATLLVNCGRGLGTAANLGCSGINLPSLIELGLGWSLKIELRESVRLDWALTGAGFKFCTLVCGSLNLGLFLTICSEISTFWFWKAWTFVLIVGIVFDSSKVDWNLPVTCSTCCCGGGVGLGLGLILVWDLTGDGCSTIGVCWALVLGLVLPLPLPLFGFLTLLLSELESSWLTILWETTACLDGGGDESMAREEEGCLWGGGGPLPATTGKCLKPCGCTEGRRQEKARSSKEWRGDMARVRKEVLPHGRVH